MMTSASTWSFLDVRSTSIPSGPGIFRSVRTMSKRPCSSLSIPEVPESAVCTSHPSVRKRSSRKVRTCGSSSTTRILRCEGIFKGYFLLTAHNITPPPATRMSTRDAPSSRRKRVRVLCSAAALSSYEFPPPATLSAQTVNRGAVIRKRKKRSEAIAIPSASRRRGARTCIILYLYHETEHRGAGSATVPRETGTVGAVPVPPDDDRSAGRADRVLRPFQGVVSHIDVRKFFPGDPVGRGEPGGRRGGRGEAVHGRVPGKVQGDFRVDPGNEVHDGADRLLRIVLPGDEEGRDLHVRGFRAFPDGVEHGRERPPADLPVELRVHRLQVDVHRVHEGEELGERLRQDVPVGDQNVGHSGLAELPGAVHDELEPDQRLVVGVGDPHRPLSTRRPDKVGNGHGGQGHRAFHQVVILAEPAMEVASDRPDRQDRPARVEVVERLLLHRVELDGGHLAVSEGEKPPPAVFAHLAESL